MMYSKSHEICRHRFLKCAKASASKNYVILRTICIRFTSLKRVVRDMDVESNNDLDGIHEILKLQVGDRVRVRGTSGLGTVTSVNFDRQDVEIIMGSMRMRIAREDIENIEGPSDNHSNIHFSEQAEISVSGHHEADLHGVSTEDAAERVDDEIDRALLGGYRSLRIIHGRGTGALRSAVRQHLSSHLMVTEFADAGLSDGADGVTVVDLGN